MARLPLAVQRMEFEGCGFSMVLPRGWAGVAMNPLHGAFISLKEQPEAAVLNVRVLEERGEPTVAGLEGLLRAQEWGCAPAGLVSVQAEGIALVGGTFAPAGERVEEVREWFLSDGRALANALATRMICREPELLLACEEMLRSLRFG